MAQHNSKMNQINIEGAKETQRILGGDERRDLRMQMEALEVPNARQRPHDGLVARPDPDGGRCEFRPPDTEFRAPNAYSTFYRNPQGEFLMSADPNFRASELFPHESWTRLENNPR